jgi:hypothetical protein
METTSADLGPWDARLVVLLEHPTGVRAAACVRAEDARILADQVELSEIAAPPFGESARARRMADLMRDARLERVATDEVGHGRASATTGAGSRRSSRWLAG